MIIRRKRDQLKNKIKKNKVRNSLTTLNRNVQDRSASFLSSGHKIPSWRDGAFLNYFNECFKNFKSTAMLTSIEDNVLRLHH